MPNWCMNNLVMTGPQNILQEIADTELQLQKLFPCPEELRNVSAPAKFNNEEQAKSNLDKYGFADWYDWQVANWGTKWDIGPLPLQVESFGDSHQISISFDSAWSPPIPALEKLFEMYKDQGLNFTLEYLEPGNGFFGTVTTEEGFFDNYQEYSSLQGLKECIKECPNTLAEDELDRIQQELEYDEPSNLFI